MMCPVYILRLFPVVPEEPHIYTYVKLLHVAATLMRIHFKEGLGFKIL